MVCIFISLQEVDTIKQCQEEMRRLIQDANNQLAYVFELY